MRSAKPPVPHALCGAHGRQKKRPCRHPAGARTDHPGIGKCWLHGGRSPVKHGAHSTVLRIPIRKLIEEELRNPNPLDTLPELATARALARDFIDRYETFSAALLAWNQAEKDDPESPARPAQVMDLADATRLLSEITKIVERIERARAANAISRTDFLRVITEFGRVVDAYVKDEPTKMKIKESWLAIRVA